MIWNTIYQYQYSDVIVSAIASQITDVSILCLTVYLGADQRKYQSYASLAFLRGITSQRTSNAENVSTDVSVEDAFVN